LREKTGLDFFITEIPEEVFTYSEEDPMAFAEPRADIYPYLLVNIGSGVSMIKVSGPQQFQRIGGSSLGGGTLWGLLSLLTQAKSFDEMLGMAEKGDNTQVDMLVGDIYGGGYGRIGLKSSTIASSFGKVFKKQTEAAAAGDHTDGETARFAPEDISRSLLYAVRYVPLPSPSSESTRADVFQATILARLRTSRHRIMGLNTSTLVARSSAAIARQ
jgi:type II pantothenate kinase